MNLNEVLEMYEQRHSQNKKELTDIFQSQDEICRLVVWILENHDKHPDMFQERLLKHTVNTLEDTLLLYDILRILHEKEMVTFYTVNDKPRISILAATEGAHRLLRPDENEKDVKIKILPLKEFLTL